MKAKTIGVLIVGFGILILVGSVTRFFFSDTLAGWFENVGDRAAETISATATKTATSFSNGVSKLAEQEFGEVREESEVAIPKDTRLIEVTHDIGRVIVTAEENLTEPKIRVKKLDAFGISSKEAGRKLTDVYADIKQSGDKVIVKTIRNGQQELFEKDLAIQYEILVPTEVEFQIQLDTGSVETKGLASELNIRVDAGRIDVDGYRGHLKAVTDAGKVTVRGGVDIREVEATSQAGAVDVYLPSNANLRIEAKSDIGSISNELGLKVNKDVLSSEVDDKLGTGRDGTVRIKTDAGPIAIKKQ